MYEEHCVWIELFPSIPRLSVARSPNPIFQTLVLWLFCFAWRLCVVVGCWDMSPQWNTTEYFHFIVAVQGYVLGFALCVILHWGMPKLNTLLLFLKIKVGCLSLSIVTRWLRLSFKFLRVKCTQSLPRTNIRHRKNLARRCLQVFLHGWIISSFVKPVAACIHWIVVVCSKWTLIS